MVLQVAPSGVRPVLPIACVVCREAVHFIGVSIGAINPVGQQAFACARHLVEHAKRSQWIVSWVDAVADKACLTKTAAP